jgi:hypothetical protein
MSLASLEPPMDPPRRPPEALREGVRDALLTALGQTGARTARTLVAAGAAGVVGSVGAVLLLAGHPFGHHPSWHLATFSCLWGALLVVAFALLWLRIQAPGWPLADGARAGVVAVGLAGVAAIFSPDPHVLHAWLAAEAGRRLEELWGVVASAAGLGLVTGALLGALAGLVTLRGSRPRNARLMWLATGMIGVLLLPGIALQCVGAPSGCFVGWQLGTLLGAASGVAVALVPWQSEPA